MSDFNKAIEIKHDYADAYNNRAVDYFAIKEYQRALEDVHEAEELGASVNPNFVNDLKNSSGRDKE